MTGNAPGKAELTKAGWLARDHFPDGVATISSLLTDGAGTAPLIKLGTAAAKEISDVADTKFLQFYFDTGATSGDNRGMYLRTYFTGIGGGGDAARIYADVSVAAANVFGAHISLGLGESTTVGSISGLGVGVRATLGLPNGALPAGGTYTALMAEIYSFGASSDAGAATEVSFIRIVNDGNTAGKNTIDDDAFLFSLQGFTADTGSLVEAGTGMGTVTGTLKIKLGADTRYIPYYSSAG